MAPFHWPTNAPHIGDTMTLSVALRQKFLSFFTALPACALTFTIALIGAAAGYWLHLPMGILLGAMGFVAIFAISGRAIFGVRVMFPAKLRMGFVPIIGLGIGGSFTPTVMGQIPSWWLSLLALALFIPMAHFIGYLIYRAGGLDRPTALFGSVPGGLIESVTLGEQVGGDVQMLALLQFLRLIFTIVLVPVSFMILTGHMVGSAAVVGVIRAPLGLLDGTILLAAGAAGLMIGRLLHLPAAIMTGPLLGSALVHLLGYVEGVPPTWAIGLTQIVIGATLGARFAGLPKGAISRASRLALANVLAAMVLAIGFGYLVHTVSGQSVSAVFLAFAPGGLAEMSLIALSLNIGMIYVAMHHVIRIFLSVIIAQYATRWL